MTDPFDGLTPEQLLRVILPGCSWRIAWQRKGWVHPKHRHTETEAAARRFIDQKLLGPDRPDLAPICLLELHRRPVGRFEKDEPIGDA